MSTSSRFDEKSRELCITTSLDYFIGQVTKHTTVKWLIVKTRFCRKCDYCKIVQLVLIS